MTTPTTGTIPALTEYQPGALTIASTVNIEIVDTSNATAAASYRMSQIDFVGKAPSVMLPANPSASDLIAYYQVSSALPKVTSIGNLSIPSGNLPTGGATGTLLAKNSLTNYDAAWTTLASHMTAGTSLTLSGSTTVTLGVTNFGITSSQIATATIIGTNIATATIASTNIATATIIGGNIATNAVGNAQFRQGAAISVVGVAGNALANVADIAASAGTQVLVSNAAGNAIAFGALTTAYLPLQFQLGNLTAHAVMIANGTNTMQATNFGTTGMFLQGAGSSANPAFALVNLSMATNVTGITGFGNGGTGTSGGFSTPFGVVLSGTTFLGATAAGATGTLLAGVSATAAPTFITLSSAIDQVNTTQGSILYRGSSLWTGLIGSTAGYVLQTLGSTANPQWVGAGGVLLNTISASQIGSAVDTTSFSSRYSRFRVTFENVCAVATAHSTTSLNMVIATTGVAWQSSGYISSIQNNVGLTTVLDGTTSLFLLSGARATTSVGTTTTYGVNGYIEIVNPSNAVFFKSINGVLNYMTQGAAGTLTAAAVIPTGFWNGAASNITAIAISFQTGNIATGTIRIYGIS